MAAPFLEVITRCFKRPLMLRRNQVSMKAQTSDDWCQTLLMDDVGRGIAWAAENLGRFGATDLAGQYIWLLDDDDECIRPELVAELKWIAGKHDPDVVMLKMDHGPLGVLPGEDHWGYDVALGSVGCSAYVVRRAVWRANAGAWRPGHYTSDYNFIAAVFFAGPVVYWHEVIASRVQRISVGSKE